MLSLKVEKYDVDAATGIVVHPQAIQGYFDLLVLKTYIRLDISGIAGAK